MSLLDEERLKRDLNVMIRLVGRNGRINNRAVGAQTTGMQQLTSHHRESIRQQPELARTNMP